VSDPRPVPVIPLDGDTRLLVLTGAGISAESGLATFRGSDGLWEDEPVDEVATPGGFARDPERVWRFYSARRAAAERAAPNAAHLALAEIERRLGGRFLLATQNVDGLHRAAGSQGVLELHGSLWRTRCSRCARPPFQDRRYPVGPPLPTCDACAHQGRSPALLRPAIVWFGEMLDPSDEHEVHRFLRGADAARAPIVFLAVGTSGTVYPAAGYVRHAAELGAATWLANLERPDNAWAFDHVVEGPATAVVPRLLGLAGA
jgi:NAD-dependent protein deacetylase/lipoamidase